MSRKIGLFTIVLLCIFISSVCAVDLSVDDAVSLAIDNSFEIKTMAQDLSYKKHKANTEWTTLIPELSAGATVYSYSADDYMNTFEFNGNLSAILKFNPASFTAIKIARTDYENGLITYEKLKNTVSCEVKKLYYNIILSGETVDALSYSADLKNDVLDIALVRYNEGALSKSEYLQTKVSYNNSVKDYRKAVQNNDNLKRQLAILLDIENSTELNLTSEIPDITELPNQLENAEDSVYSSYEVIDAQNRANLSKLVKNSLDTKAFVPSLAIGQTWNTVIVKLGDKPKGNNYINDGYFLGSVTWSISDMLPSSDNRREALSAENEYKKAVIEKNHLIQDNRAKIIKAVENIINSYDNIEFSNDALDVAQSACDSAKLEYEQGSISIVEFNTSVNELLSAKLENLSSKAEYISALIELSSITGNSYI